MAAAFHNISALYIDVDGMLRSVQLKTNDFIYAVLLISGWKERQICICTVMNQMVRGGFLHALIVHGIFSQFGDLMSACFNLMNMPVRTFELLISGSASSMFVGLSVGFALMGFLMDHIGRKQTAVYLRSALGIIGSISMIIGQLYGRFEFYIFGHILAGIITGLKVVLIIYISECAVDKHRGLSSMVLNSCGITVVMLFTPLCLPQIFGSTKFWILLPCFTGLMATLHIILGLALPQSPRQLYIQEHNEIAARHSIEYYYGPDVVEELIEEMEVERITQSKKKMSLREVLEHRTHRKSMRLVLILAFLPVLSAYNIKSQYLNAMLLTYGLHQSQATTALMLISLAGLPMCFLAPFIIGHCGKRFVFTLVAALCSGEWLLLSFAQCILDVSAQDLSNSWLYACIGAVVGQVGVNLGLLVLSPMLLSQICPHETRAAISQITQVLPIVFASAEVFLFPMLRESFGASLFLFLAACCAAMAVLLSIQVSPSRMEIFSNRGILAVRSSTILSYGSISSLDIDEKKSLLDEQMF